MKFAQTSGNTEDAGIFGSSIFRRRPVSCSLKKPGGLHPTRRPALASLDTNISATYARALTKNRCSALVLRWPQWRTLESLCRERRDRISAMRVRVLFFGQLKEIVGLAAEDAGLSEGARVEDLFERYARRFPKLAEFRGSVAPSVNQEYAEWRAPLAAGDEVAFLPPVSGGQGTTIQEDVFQLVRQPIQPSKLLENMKASEDGALVVFDGFVRNNFKGNRTLYLEYEAYETMALGKMREIGAQIRDKFPIHRVAIIHRLGRLEIGETSVWIAVSSAHRSAAFDACRYAIDTLKRAVPIWKKEFFAGGAIWADGETPSQEAISPPDESKSATNK
jgi:molybdopterin converting factor subunit 1